MCKKYTMKLIVFFLLQLKVSIAVTYIPPVAKSTRFSQPDFFETTANLIFKVKVPSWTLQNLLVTGLSSCASSEYSAGSYCPLQFYLQESNLKLNNKIISISDSIPGSHQAPPSDDNACDEIARHFQARVTKGTDVESYIETLKVFCRGPTLVSNVQFDSVDFWSAYRQAITDYTLEYFTVATDKITGASHASANAALMSYGLLHFSIEKMVWNTALEMCSSSRFPTGLIDQAVLESELRKLEILIRDKLFINVIDFESIAEYASLPLTDCTIDATKSELVVKISVPIIHQDVTWSLVDLSVIPFRYTYNGEVWICATEAIQNQPIQTPIAHESNLYSSHRRSYEPSCKYYNGRWLCKVTRKDNLNKKPNWKFDCKEFILDASPSPQDIIKHCPLQCQRISEFRLPLVLQTNENELYLVGEPSQTVTKSCNGLPDVVEFLPALGALHIVLPCDCVIKIGTVEINAHSPSCSPTGLSEVVLPFNVAEILKDSHFSRT